MKVIAPASGQRKPGEVADEIAAELRNSDIFYMNGALRQVIGGKTEKVDKNRLKAVCKDYVVIAPLGNNAPYTFPTNDMYDILLGAPEKWARPLDKIVSCPYIAKDGVTVIDTAGYNESTRIWLNWDGGKLNLPSYEDAIDTVAELVRTWRWAGDASGSYSATYALGMLILPVLMQYIDGPTPLHVISASDSRAGKSYLADTLSVLAGDVDQRGMDEWGSEARREIREALAAGPGVIYLDNVPGQAIADNTDLLRFVTASFGLKLRLTGGRGEVSVTTRPIWVLTAIDLHTFLTKEFAGRSVVIKLKPFSKQREDKNLEPLDRVRQNRSGYIAALMRLALDGLAEGSWSSFKRLDGFPSWSLTMGKVLSRMGAANFLDGRAVPMDDYDLVQLYRYWPTDDEGNDRFASSSDVRKVIFEHGLAPIPGKPDPTPTQLGIFLQRLARAERKVFGYQLECERSGNSCRYRPILVVTPVEPSVKNEADNGALCLVREYSDEEDAVSDSGPLDL